VESFQGCTRYRPTDHDAIRDKVVLAAVESQFNPRAAGAVRIWQFMSAIGREYDLVGP